MSKTIKQEYNSLKATRQYYLDRAETNSSLTIPSLFRNENSNAETAAVQLSNNLGSRGVNILSSKLLNALFPPNQPFFRYAANSAELEKEVTPDQKPKANSILAKIEQMVQSKVETSGVLGDASEAFRHLLVSGNGLLFVDDELTTTFYSLDKYVVQRDPSGKTKKVIIKESVDARLITNDVVRESVIEKLDSTKSSVKDEDKKYKTDLFTKVVWDSEQVVMNQEVEGELLWSEDEYTYPVDASPWIPLRYNKVSGEDYGRSFIEDYIQDLEQLNTLTLSVREYAKQASHLWFFIDPSSPIDPKKLRKTPNRGHVRGKVTDVQAWQVDKNNDLAIARSTVQDLDSSLSRDFLMTSSVQQDRERVTATEIRALVAELESGLSGVYSLLANELQLPLVKRILNVLERKGDIPEVGDASKPVLITGTDALARSSEQDKQDLFIAKAGELIANEEVLSKYFNIPALLQSTADNIGYNTDGKLKQPEEVDQPMVDPSLAQGVDVDPAIVDQVSQAINQNQ